MSVPFTFHQNLILRTPHFSFIESIPDSIIADLLESKAFLEALYLASPVLYDECMKLKTGEIETEKEIKKITASVIKYYQRMYSRCTPFGMFSGCSVAAWHNKTCIEFADDCIERYTRLDMHYMCALAQHIEQLADVKPHLKFKPNNSYYQIGNEIRYIEYKYKDGKRIHQISAVAYNDYLAELLQKATTGITIIEAEEILFKYVDDKEEVKQFISDILQSQLLVSELEPSITGNEFIVQIIGKLQNINSHKNVTINFWIKQLQLIEEGIKKLDTQKINDVTAYRAILKTADVLGVKYEENKFFK